MHQEVSGPPPINFVKQWTMQESTIQSPIIHLEFSQNLSETPWSLVWSTLCNRERYIERKRVNVETDFLQLISTGWNRILMGQGMCWRRCFDGLSWSLHTASTSPAKEEGSWYDMGRFFYRHTALENGTDISPFSYERLKHNTLLSQDSKSCNCTSLCGKMYQWETLR